MEYFGLNTYATDAASIRLSIGSVYRNASPKLVRSVRFRAAPRAKYRTPLANGSTQPLENSAVRSPTFQFASYSMNPTVLPKLSRVAFGNSDTDMSSVNTS